MIWSPHNRLTNQMIENWSIPRFSSQWSIYFWVGGLGWNSLSSHCPTDWSCLEEFPTVCRRCGGSLNGLIPDFHVFLPSQMWVFLRCAALAHVITRYFSWCACGRSPGHQMAIRKVAAPRLCQLWLGSTRRWRQSRTRKQMRYTSLLYSEYEKRAVWNWCG